ncbi:adenylate/guanylate cyclase domain-containing protein [Fulvivirga sedimenti]|uniref:Adenylate cyclase n=1 Tax=Fulvivirga sedimenti TaxID=2879465 RepID=A0A9X1HRF7_9BACT|nr:adenylate/guanylate cyclase domain-containing protein [Fulvivirga sedimenti]MCA6075623.1 adenylate/guanylate cyclase domain-containing protein [Fulvivirga sedimenti]
MPITVFSQILQQADSLEDRYLKGDFPEEERIALLRELAYAGDVDKMLKYSNELIETAERLDSLDGLGDGYIYKGHALRLKSDLPEALKNYFEATRIGRQLNKVKRIARSEISIADVYSMMGNHQNAVRYYQSAIGLLRDIQDSIGFSSALENLGDEYLTVDMPDSALMFFDESGRVFRAMNYTEGLAYNLGNRGIAYAQLGRDQMAKDTINRAVTMMEIMQNYYPISVYLTYMSDIYLNQGNWTVAMNYAQRSLEIAQKHGLKDQLSGATLKISELYEQKGEYSKSLDFYKQHIAYRDSVNNIASVQEMANIRANFEIAQNKEMAEIRANFEIAQKQVEVDLLNQKRRVQQIIVIAVASALFLISLLALGLFRRNKFIQRTKRLIEKEKDRSDNLLLNILPEETAQELKESGRVKAKRFESVTVLFTDFKGFTYYSEDLTPEQLVKSVDFYFSKFDEIIEKYGLEKIKTIGDAYMCAGGLPFPSEDHALKVTQAAFEIAEFMEEMKQTKEEEIAHFEVRIGINTGPVVAGVVGTKKFAYDIWGDTVNIASRMESNSLPGHINISENTHQLVKDHFDCIFRGEIHVKNKGMMKMYFVNRKHNSNGKSNTEHIDEPSSVQNQG